MERSPGPEHEGKPIAAPKQTPKNPIFLLSVEELEKRLQPLYTTIAATAQEVEELVNVMSSYAIFAQYNERHYNTLADSARKVIALLQAVTSGHDITPVWLMQRDLLVAQMRKLIDDQSMSDPTTKEGTTPP